MVRLLSSFVAFAVLSSPAFAENWPQWRGPKNDGMSTEKNLPGKWGFEAGKPIASDTKPENIVWKTKLPGPGASTPCIWGEHIFVTAQEDSGLSLICIGTDGQEKWKKQLSAGTGKARGDEGNLASASCSTDGKQVYAFVGSGELVAYDLDGKEAWKVDTVKTYGKYQIQFGGHWTPVLHKGKLYVTLMHQKLQTIVCFDAASGKEDWKTPRTSDGKGESPDVYSSPFVWEKGDKALLIVHGNDYCTAHELADGKEVWRVTELNPKKNYNNAWRAVSSPLVTPDLIVVPSCKQHPTVAIDPNGAAGEIAPGASLEKWRFKSTPDVPSPLLVDGVVYLMGANGQLTAVDAKTGKELYGLRITNERHRANPAYFDGKILLVGREGNMVVIKPGTTADPAPIKNKLNDTFTGSPAISGGRIYLRGWNYLWAIGTK